MLTASEDLDLLWVRGTGRLLVYWASQEPLKEGLRGNLVEPPLLAQDFAILPDWG